MNQCWLIVNWTISEILIEIHIFSVKKMWLKMSPAKLATILSRGRWVKKDEMNTRNHPIQIKKRNFLINAKAKDYDVRYFSSPINMHIKWCFNVLIVIWAYSLQWRHNELAGVSNHQPHDCLLNRSFRRGSKKTSKLRVTGLCVGNSPVSSPHSCSLSTTWGLQWVVFMLPFCQ